LAKENIINNYKNITECHPELVSGSGGYSYDPEINSG